MIITSKQHLIPTTISQIAQIWRWTIKLFDSRVSAFEVLHSNNTLVAQHPWIYSSPSCKNETVRDLVFRCPPQRFYMQVMEFQLPPCRQLSSKIILVNRISCNEQILAEITRQLPYQWSGWSSLNNHFLMAELKSAVCWLTENSS